MEVKLWLILKMVITSWKVTKKNSKTYKVKFLYTFEEETSH